MVRGVMQLSCTLIGHNEQENFILQMTRQDHGAVEQKFSQGSKIPRRSCTHGKSAWCNKAHQLKVSFSLHWLNEFLKHEV